MGRSCTHSLLMVHSFIVDGPELHIAHRDGPMALPMALVSQIPAQLPRYMPIICCFPIIYCMVSCHVGSIAVPTPFAVSRYICAGNTMMGWHIRYPMSEIQDIEIRQGAARRPTAAGAFGFCSCCFAARARRPLGTISRKTSDSTDEFNGQKPPDTFVFCYERTRKLAIILASMRP
jgi:hypothetical protein